PKLSLERIEIGGVGRIVPVGVPALLSAELLVGNPSTDNYIAPAARRSVREMPASPYLPVVDAIGQARRHSEITIRVGREAKVAGRSTHAYRERTRDRWAVSCL